MYKVSLYKFDTQLPEHSHGAGFFNSLGDGADVVLLCGCDQLADDLLCAHIGCKGLHQ